MGVAGAVAVRKIELRLQNHAYGACVLQVIGNEYGRRFHSSSFSALVAGSEG